MSDSTFATASLCIGLKNHYFVVGFSKQQKYNNRFSTKKMEQ